MPMPTIVEMKLKRSRPERFILLLEDGTEVLVAPETVVKHSLAPGVEIPEAEWFPLLAEDEIQRAKDQALRYLERRPHSRQELVRKLRQKHYSMPAIEAALTALQKVDLVNDEQFARQYVETEMLLRPVGKRLLKQKLRERGIPDAISDPLLEAVFRQHSEVDIAHRLAQKFLKRHGHREEKKRRAALVRFLQSKGFDWDVIQEVLETLAHPDTDEG